MNALSDLIIHVTTFLIRVIPTSWFGPVTSVLSAAAYRMSVRDNRIMKKNIADILHLPADTHFSDMFRRQVFRHQIISTLETVRTAYDSDKLVIVGYEEFAKEIAQAVTDTHGIVCITGHMGSWEICARYCVRALPSTFHVLAKPSKNKAFNKFLDRMRILAGANVFWTDKKGLLKDMLTALKKNETVGFVMDQKPAGRKGPVVDFYGRQTEFVSGPASMASRTGSPIIAVYCMRIAPFTYRLYAEVIAEPSHGINDELALTQKMAASIEAKIKDYPEQWTWNYKRWRI